MKGAYRKAGDGLFKEGYVVTGGGELALNCKRGRFRLDIRNCPERLWMPLPWRHSRPSWMGL